MVRTNLSGSTTKVENEKARATTTPGVQAVKALVVGRLLRKEKDRTKEKARQTERNKEQKERASAGLVVETTTRETAVTRIDLYSKSLRKVLRQGRIRLLQQLRWVVVRQVPTSSKMRAEYITKACTTTA